MYLEKFLLKNERHATVRLLSDFFYGKTDVEKAKEVTGLSYLGEYLERHIQTDITEREILLAVAIQPGDMKEYQLYDGQMDMFLDRIEALKEEDKDFKFNLIYAIFLQKLNIESKFDAFAEDFVQNLSLDDDFLILTQAIKYGYLKITKRIREIIISKLNEGKIKIDMDLVIEAAKYNSYSMSRETQLEVLKSIFNVYNLKKSEFKGNPDKFEGYKSLRKFGTKDSNYEISKAVLELDKQEFYYTALKVANETYAEGQAMVRANEALLDELRQNINPNSYLCGTLNSLCLKVTGGYSRGLVSLSEVDFSSIEEKYFKMAIELNYNHINSIKIEKIIGLFEREDFVRYIESKQKSEIEPSIIKVAVNTINLNNKRDISERYYNVIKDVKSLTAADIAVLCARGLASIELISNKIFEKTNEINFTVNGDMMYMIDACCKHNFDSVMLQIMMEMVNKNVICDDVYWRAQYFQMMISRVEKVYLDNPEVKTEVKISTIKLLEEFILMYDSALYYKYIITHIEDELFRNTLNISDDDVKMICKYLLERDYVRYDKDMRSSIEKAIYSEEDLEVAEGKKKIDMYLDDVGYNAKYADFKSIVDSIKQNDNVKSRVIEYLKESTCNLSLSYEGNSVFFYVIADMIKNGLIDDEEGMDMVKNRLQLIVAA